MSIAQALLPEFDQESANTRKVLERIPDDKLDYKPSPKSMALGQLAAHIAEMIGWTVHTITLPGYDIPADFKPFAPKSSAEILAEYDKNAAGARAALAEAKDSSMGDMWKLSMSGQELVNLPRGVLLRSMIFNHIIHHRAQITVYFRLLGIAVPGMYGPSADEQQGAASA